MVFVFEWAVWVLMWGGGQVDEMKKHLERKAQAGKAQPKLRDMDAGVLPAAWSILRW